MKELWLAVCVGCTVYCFATHAPLWLCIANVVIDAYLILEYLKRK